MVPSLGQAYNKEYWKIPLAYAAISTAYIFVDNIKTYKLYRDAYRLRVGQQPDTNNTSPDTKPYITESLKLGRDRFRRYVDYSVLFFYLACSVNGIDATVFAHLRNFDMSDDLQYARVSHTDQQPVH